MFIFSSCYTCSKFNIKGGLINKHTRTGRQNATMRGDYLNMFSTTEVVYNIKKFRDNIDNGVMTNITEFAAVLKEFFKEMPYQLENNHEITEIWAEINSTLKLLKLNLNDVVSQEEIDDFLLKVIESRNLKFFKEIISSNCICISPDIYALYKETIYEVGHTVQKVKFILKHRMFKRFFNLETTADSKNVLVQEFNLNETPSGKVRVHVEICEGDISAYIAMKGNNKIDITSSCKHYLKNSEMI